MRSKYKSMRKRLAFFVIIIIIAFSFMSCAIENNETTLYTEDIDETSSLEGQTGRLDGKSDLTHLFYNGTLYATDPYRFDGTHEAERLRFSDNFIKEHELIYLGEVKKVDNNELPRENNVAYMTEENAEIFIDELGRLYLKNASGVLTALRKSE